MALRSRPRVRNIARTLLLVLLGACAAFAHAAFIDFEDLPPIPGNEDLTGYPVTTQYAHLGVTFQDNVYLVHWIEDASLVSFLDDGSLSFRFSGTLPTQVSFDVLSGQPLSVRWRGATGRGENIELDQGAHVSFSSQAGVALVKIVHPVGVRPDYAGFDNLFFAGGNVPAVPEPAPFALAGVGLLALAWRRWRGHRAIGKNCPPR